MGGLSMPYSYHHPTYSVQTQRPTDIKDISPPNTTPYLTDHFNILDPRDCHTTHNIRVAIA